MMTERRLHDANQRTWRRCGTHAHDHWNHRRTNQAMVQGERVWLCKEEEDVERIIQEGR